MIGKNIILPSRVENLRIHKNQTDKLHHFQMTIGIVLPCYKVSRHIKGVIESIPGNIRHIIVIDDKCPEGTGGLVEQLANERVTVVYHQENKGVGGATISGYKKALELDCDIVVKMDGDGQMHPDFLEKLVQLIVNGQADYTKGNRFYDLIALKDMPKRRILGNSVLSFVTKAASGYWHIMDVVNGYTAISAKTLKELDFSDLATDYFFEIDMLSNLGIRGKVVKDIAIPARYGNEKSNMKLWYIFVSFPLRLLKRFVKRVYYSYFLYDFNMGSVYILLGTFLFTWGGGYGIYKWLEGISTGIANNAGTVMLSVVPFILGIQFLLQALSIDINNIPTKSHVTDQKC